MREKPNMQPCQGHGEQNEKIRRCWFTGSTYPDANPVHHRRLGKIGDGYAGTQQYMEAMGVPGFLLPLTILLELGGGLAILFGS